MSQKIASSPECQISTDPKDLQSFNGSGITSFENGQPVTFQTDGSKFCMRIQYGDKNNYDVVSVCAPASSIAVACKQNNQTRVCLMGGSPDEAVKKCHAYN